MPYTVYSCLCAVGLLLPLQNKCTQPDNVKLCALILRPANTSPQRKKVVSFLMQWISSGIDLFVGLTFYSLVSLWVSDPCERGSGSPTWEWARPVPAPDWAKPSSSSCCSSNLLPVWAGQDLSGHFNWTCPSCSLSCDTINPFASLTHPWQLHEGPRGMEGTQWSQRTMGNH